VDPVASNSRLLDRAYLGKRHYEVAMRVKQTIARYRELEDIIFMLGTSELRLEDQQAVRRARRLERFLTQPLFVTERLQASPGGTSPWRTPSPAARRFSVGNSMPRTSTGST